MKAEALFLLSFGVFFIVSPGLGLRIRTNDEGLSGSPTLIYRRRLNSDRHQSIYPPTSPSINNSIEEKTELDNNNDSIGQGSTEDPLVQNTFSSKRPKKIKSTRRNRSRTRLRTVPIIPQEPVIEEPIELNSSQKPTKLKGSRRRKVKRPNKTKPPTPTKQIEDDQGADKEKSSGDKNLALEIGSDDGKYALIDKFFESKAGEAAPGIISYASSDDFPRADNKYTLGNVKENDIWLSESHLLVLKGGDLDGSNNEEWKPIDNYQRGSRPPLRIALDSNNPPPFPVFVNESGPPVFLGPPPPFGLPYPPPGAFGNDSIDPSRYPVPPGMIPLFPNGTLPRPPPFFGRPPPGAFGNGSGLFPHGPPPGQYGMGGGGNRNGSFHLPPFPPGRFGNNSFPPPPFFPFPPIGNRNGSVPPIFLPPPPGFNNGNFSGGPPGGFPLLPPLVLNPNDNETDDPSIFLPPPYDFDYQDDNTTLVPPGPFAPGLVVPPPRNFYTVYNKSSTKTRTTLPPATGLSYIFGKRPQRPNGKKPKFPMTNPPDDSEEAYRPVTTPYVNYNTEAPLKKRKQRPGKLNKGLFGGSKYEADTDINQVIVSSPQPQPPSSLINIPVITNTIPPIIITTTTPKPLNNYVYVRGQLQSLAELSQPQDEFGYESTPRPPFDERGYPTRVIDDGNSNDQQYEYNKKVTQAPPKAFYYNTPKYGAFYNSYTKKPKTKLRNQYFSINQNEPINQQQPQLPIVTDQQQPPSIYLNNRLSNQEQSVYSPHHGNTFQQDDKVTAIVDPIQYPIYNNRHQNGLPQQHFKKPIIQLQSPKSSYAPTTTTNSNNRQPHHLYNHASIPQNVNYQTTSGFRPAFGPNLSPQLQQQQQAEQGDRTTFPGQNIYNFQNPYLQPQQQQQQQGNPQINNGYYSPISNYYQPLQQQLQNFYNPNSQQNYFNSQNQNPIYQQNNQLQPFFGQQSRLQTLTNEYKSPIQQFLPQSQQQTPIGQNNAYVNYREPLPEYNTESGAVTTRTQLTQLTAAGPSKAPQKGNEIKTDGSYYSFQRGGPGGFSYKIKL